jgi:hypothetical protein
VTREGADGDEVTLGLLNDAVGVCSWQPVRVLAINKETAQNEIIGSSEDYQHQMLPGVITMFGRQRPFITCWAK